MSRKASAIFGCGFLILSTLLPRLLLAGSWNSEASVTRNPDESLCETLQRHLNGAGEKCFEIGLQTFPGFSSPPWQRLDPKEHLELIARLLAYESGRDRYFAAPPNLEPFLRGAKEFIEEGGDLWIWRARLLSHFGDNANLPAPPGEQTFVRLIYRPGIRNHDPACTEEASQIGIGPTFLVLADLSGPDPRLEQGTAYVLRTHQPMIYQNEVLFVGTFAQDVLGAQADVFKNYEQTGLKGGVCIFKYSMNDADLNATYKILRDRLRGTALEKQLVEAERSWIRRRDSGCKKISESDYATEEEKHAARATIAANLAACMDREAQARQEFLKEALSRLDRDGIYNFNLH